MKKANKPLTDDEKQLLSETLDDNLLAVFQNHTRRFLRKEKKKLPIKEQIQIDRDTFSERSKFKTVDKKYKELIKEIECLEKEKEAIIQLHGNLSFYKIKPLEKLKSEATAFLVASDWHIEELVKSGTVNGLNEFNLEIAGKRIKKFFQNSLKLIKKEHQDVHIKTIVLALLGDFISGNIHEELMETAQLEPIFASISVQEHIASGIQFLLDNTDCNLVIPCCAGNHSRITKKQRVSTEIGNALETMIYHNLALYFKNNKRVNFVLQEGYFIFLDVYGYIVRLHHGHDIRYAGGVGGIYIPTNKAIAQWNKAKHADLDVFGHWHQQKMDGHFIINGSLIGYNPFAIKIKADFEEPKQTFFLIDKKRGKTIFAPILLNGGKNEK